ncbi:MAG TPA: thiamine pyrophosphate-dependent enzyme [Candidatus Angelobacter sp.]|nr:thiamine pyrophosphate-dependent enzyme [Candidatus Angelobacter sp.]
MAQKNKKSSAAKTTSTASATSNEFAVLKAGNLRSLYAAMLKSRLMEEAIGALKAESGGQHLEAAEAGATAHLQADDAVAPWGRDPVFQCLRGVSLEIIFARTESTKNAKAAKPARTKKNAKNGKAPAKTPPPLKIIACNENGADRLSMATGVALACQAEKKSKKVVVAFSSALSGMQQEALGFAAKNKLPIVFVLPSTPQSSGQSRDYEIPSITVDGKDAVAMYRVSQEAVRRAREGHGPALIYCAGLRATQAASEDPLAHMENYLRQKKLWSDAWKRKIADGFRQELKQVRPRVRPRRTA